LVRVPQQAPVSDEELLRRFGVLSPNPTKYQTACLASVRQQLASNGPEAVTWRRRQLAQMGDISAYMKLVKQRFSIWFNQSYGRVGTLWCERFKSELVQAEPHALETVAAYIDLNAVRAGLVTDPKDYRWCGYAEAVGGEALARHGLALAVPEDGWAAVQARYRLLLFGTGSAPRESGAGIAPAEFAAVAAAGGRLPLATALRGRLRFLIDGGVLGTQEFVAQQLAEYQRRTGRRKRTRPRPPRLLADWGDLMTMRSVRQDSDG
jgi:hypothetical protein